MRGLMYHIDLTVREPARAAGFYDALPGVLGYERIRSDPTGIDWNLRILPPSIRCTALADPGGLKLEFVHCPCGAT